MSVTNRRERVAHAIGHICVDGFGAVDVRCPKAEWVRFREMIRAARESIIRTSSARFARVQSGESSEAVSHTQSAPATQPVQPSAPAALFVPANTSCMFPGDMRHWQFEA
jgi:hypothetical protein